MINNFVLNSLMRDPRYWKHHEPDITAEVTRLFILANPDIDKEMDEYADRFQHFEDGFRTRCPKDNSLCPKDTRN